MVRDGDDFHLLSGCHLRTHSSGNGLAGGSARGHCWRRGGPINVELVVTQALGGAGANGPLTHAPEQTHTSNTLVLASSSLQARPGRARMSGAELGRQAGRALAGATGSKRDGYRRAECCGWRSLGGLGACSWRRAFVARRLNDSHAFAHTHPLARQTHRVELS